MAAAGLFLVSGAAANGGVPGVPGAAPDSARPVPSEWTPSPPGPPTAGGSASQQPAPASTQPAPSRNQPPSGGGAVSAAPVSAVLVPFGPGEKLDYRVSVGILGGAGRAAMEVVGIDTIRTRPVYHLRFDLKGGPPLARVDDTFRSWLDVATLTSLRFEQRQAEVRYRRHRVFDFYPQERRWERQGTRQSGRLPTDQPLDDVSFLYFARTLPLEPGHVYTLSRYFQEGGNPVTIRVLRRERVRVPLGTYDTIVVQPIIKARGLFGEGGRAEVYLTDDARRLPVLVRSRMRVLGYVNLELRAYTAGKPLTGG